VARERTGMLEYEDTLEVLGVLVGAFVVITGLGTFLGTPWATNPSTLAVAIQMVGVVAAVAVGLVLLWLSHTGDLGGRLPGSENAE